MRYIWTEMLYVKIFGFSIEQFSLTIQLFLEWHQNICFKGPVQFCKHVSEKALHLKQPTHLFS